MFYVLSFLFGSAIGSFVQLVVTRLHVAPTIFVRSKCLSCGEALRHFDLIPIFSYLFLRGKCRYCKSVFGVSSLIIELFYGVVFVLLYHFILASHVSLLISSLWLVYYSLLFVVLGIIALYDYAHTYIPIQFLFFYCILTFLMLAIRYIDGGGSMTLLAPIIVAFPFLLIWLITRGKGLGFGDVMLFLGVGAFFGVEQGLAVLLFSIWMGAIVGICIYVIRRKNLIKNTAIPFIPFIVFAFLIILFTDIDIFSIAQTFA